MARGRERRGDCSTATRARRRAWRRTAATCGATARPRWRTGWGSPTPTSTAPLDTFSGGQLTRASLARALATGADVLLLDEPTNHLDIESLEWLEQTLVDLDAAVVLVAHDRWFLEAVGTAVLELGGRHARASSPARWHAWRTRAGRARDRARQGDRQAAGGDRAHGALHRALPLQGDEGPPGAVAREEARRRSSASSAIPATGRALEFAFKAPERSGRVVFELSDAAIDVGEARRSTLLEHAELWLERGEHVSLVGPNGVGQDDPDRDARRTAPARARASSAPATT